MSIPKRLLEQIEEGMRANEARVAATRVAQQQSLEAGKKALGDASYSWISNPAVFGVNRNQFNAKTLPFSETGVGLTNYGWNEKNIFSQLDRARKAYQSGDKSGGYGDIYKYMLEQAGTFSSPQQARLFKGFLETGKRPDGLSMDTIMQISDYGLRATARKQQRKQTSFFGGNIGAIIGAIGGAAIGFAMGGPGGAIAGAKAGGAAGGAGQAINEGQGLLGVTLGTVGGYGIGSLGGSLGSAAAATAKTAATVGWPQALASSLRSGIGSLGSSLKSTVLNPLGAVKSTFQGMYNDLINPLMRTGQGLYQGIGSLANPNMTFGQGFRAGFYGPPGGIASLSSTPTFSEATVREGLGGNVIEVPEFQSIDVGFDQAAPLPGSSAESLAERTVRQGLEGTLEQARSLPLPDLQYAPPLEGLIEPDAILSRVGSPTGVYDASQMRTFSPGPVPTKVGTFNPRALEVPGLVDQALPVQNIAPGFSYQVQPVVSQYGAEAATQILPSSQSPFEQQVRNLPTPLSQRYGLFGVPTTLAAGKVLEGTLEALDPPRQTDPESEGAITEQYQRDPLPEVEGFGDPLAYQALSTAPAVGSGRIGYDEGALGRRLYGTGIQTLDNPYDLNPYFRSPVFAAGGAVDTGFPMMEEIPADMQAKFMKYESGTQSYRDSAGGDEERGYRRMSGTGMDPVEESYVSKPVGIQEFFRRTPEGRFEMA
jgi:hypothetical protein